MSTSFDKLSIVELKRKKDALLVYIRRIDRELEERKQYNQQINKKKVTKINKVLSLLEEKKDRLKKLKIKLNPSKSSSIKKINKTSIKSNNQTSKKPKITIKIIKQVLDDSSIQYKSNCNKSQLMDLIRKHNKVRICERLAKT